MLGQSRQWNLKICQPKTERENYFQLYSSPLIYSRGRRFSYNIFLTPCHYYRVIQNELNIEFSEISRGQMHFGLSKNNISLVLCFSSLLPSPPATNCHRYSFSFGANNTFLFKIQPSSNAKLLRAAYTRATRQRQSNGVNSIYVLHCCHLA